MGIQQLCDKFLRILQKKNFDHRAPASDTLGSTFALSFQCIPIPRVCVFGGESSGDLLHKCMASKVTASFNVYLHARLLPCFAYVIGIECKQVT